MLVPTTIFFAAFLAGSSDSEVSADAIVDSYRRLVCKPPILEANRSCIMGKATLHLETLPGSGNVAASLVSVTPSVFSGWAECIAKHWNEISFQSAADEQHNVTINLNLSGGDPCPNAR